MIFPVIVEDQEEESGLFPVYCPGFPGAVSQGTSKEDAVRNIKEALIGLLKSYRSSGEEIPMSYIDLKDSLYWVEVHEGELTDGM